MTFLPSGAASAVAGAEQTGVGTGLHEAGGGVVTREENYAPLHQNGTIIFLTRQLEALATDQRPLSAAHGVAALYEARLPLYTKWADGSAACLPEPDDTAKAILRAVNR